MLPEDFTRWLAQRSIDEQTFQKLNPAQRMTLHREFARGGTQTHEERFLKEVELKHGSVENALKTADAETRLRIAYATGKSAPEPVAVAELPGHLANASPGYRRILLDNWNSYHANEAEIRRLRGIDHGGSVNLINEIANRVRKLQEDRTRVRFEHPALRLSPHPDVDSVS